MSTNETIASTEGNKLTESEQNARIEELLLQIRQAMSQLLSIWQPSAGTVMREAKTLWP